MLRIVNLVAVVSILVLVGILLAGYQSLRETRRVLAMTHSQLVTTKENLARVTAELTESQFELAILRWIASCRPDVSASELTTAVIEATRRWGGSHYQQLCLDVVALGEVESQWHTNKVGLLGERGPLQVKPGTAADMGCESASLGNWHATLVAGVRYFATVCLPRAKGDRRLAIAYYNAGPYRDGAEALQLAHRYVRAVEMARGKASRYLSVR